MRHSCFTAEFTADHFSNSACRSSDHLGVSLLLDVKVKRYHSSHPRRTVWLYGKANFNKVKALIQETDWDNILSGTVDQCAESWTQTFLDIMKRSIPSKKLLPRKTLPWLSSKIMRLVRKRNTLFSKAKKSGKLSDRAKYCQMRNRVVNLLRSSKKIYFNNFNTDDKKQFWKTFKVLNRKQTQVPMLVLDNAEATTDSEKADMLNTYFAECWNKLVPPLTTTSTSHEYMYCEDELLCCEEEVYHLLLSLDTSKATGPDGISVRMLKETACSIVPSLTKLFNIVLRNRCFPECWKCANVIPIPKNTSQKSDPAGYRPISLLPVVSKVLEKHIYSVISDHLSEHHPIGDNKWGFQSGRSCATALLATTNAWYVALEQGKDVAVVFFDFQKAFDSVPHQLLIQKLYDAGLNPCLVECIVSYLQKRKQRVVINGSESAVFHAISGVPQGSVLGPLLFLVYINDLCHISLSHGSHTVLYADDLVLYKVIGSNSCSAYGSICKRILTELLNGQM